ncbi:hypothetical protein [Amycolatopsis taiwanensis]|uniref:hypothetical protein n=1 Tax=Amycolatopsis taiwanensis TaxID=342230 RepID=UPI0004B093C8|nr:hypothetical protein [Amycolatopsis taiwanensis]
MTGRAKSARPGGAEPIERVAVQVDRLCWTGILLGLAFTMTNVQQFAAAGSRPWSLPWWGAWLLDPMVSLVLLAILRAEQVTARHGVRTGGWVRGAKWFTLGATYVMNTWEAYANRSPALVVLHSVPPLVVFVAAEAVTDLRDKLGEAVSAAFTNAPETTRRTSFSDYLAVARAAYTQGTTVTPAWVREVTGCSRGLSSRLAAELRAETEVRP